jgi:two-component system cell cycle sensor histidine kinase/response regulator CckA
MMIALSRPRDSELYQLFDRSPIGMYRSTEQGGFKYVNGALARMLGYSVDELLALNIVRDVYVDPIERPRLVAKYGPHGMIDGATVTWKHKDGRVLKIRLYGHVVDSGEGKWFDASCMDITELEATNAELRRQREEIGRTATTLDLVVRQASAIWWLVDTELRILRTGGAVLEVLGYPPETYIGTTLYDVLREDPSADRTSIEAHLKALRGETATYTSEYRNKLLQNTVAPYRLDGLIVGAIGTNVDVTAMRTLERRMVDAQRAESLGVLAGGLAHDFNNLLVAILGNADLGLRDTPRAAPGRSALENIRDASLRAAELTGQLLAYAGRAGVSKSRVEPGPLVEELLRISAPRMPANVAVRIDIPPNLAIRGDAGQIRQVLLNLIANARDAIGEQRGSLAVIAQIVHHDGTPHPDDVVTASAGSYAMLEVTDDGAGMDGETRRRIFDPFFTTKPTGHGLGLAAVLGIVRAHGGGMRLVTSPGRGASFQMLWPSTESGEQVAQTDRTLRTVLVIDDEDLVRDVVARMIEDLGYSTLTASDGASGLELVERESVDAVLVDLTMPNMSGAEVVAVLRERRPTLPVIVCTGYDRDRRGSVEAHAYLPKPFRIEALEKTLASIFGSARP